LKVFFDQGTPVPLRRFATEHAGFEVFVTTDQNLKYQQNLDGRKIAIVVILTTSWPRIQADLEPVLAAIDSATPGV